MITITVESTVYTVDVTGYGVVTVATGGHQIRAGYWDGHTLTDRGGRIGAELHAAIEAALRGTP